jgi:hypothetical protein
MPADIDRRYAKDHLPDHAALLANIVRWAAGDDLPMTVDGTGFIDCHLYEQPGRLMLHMVNLTSEATWRAPVDELIRVGPFKVKTRVPRGATKVSGQLLVAGRDLRVSLDGGVASFDVESILDHEVIVIAL